MALKHLGLNKKAAFVSLMVEVINADDNIDATEFILFNDINELERIGTDAFELGKKFDLELALATLKRCSSAVKCEIATWLICLAESDGTIQAPERVTLHMIFDRLGILDELPKEK